MDKGRYKDDLITYELPMFMRTEAKHVCGFYNLLRILYHCDEDRDLGAPEDLDEVLQIQA